MYTNILKDKKMLFILILIFILILLGCKLRNDSKFQQHITYYGKDPKVFCESKMAETSGFLIEQNPTEYIKNHKSAAKLDIWKNELMQRNNWNENYFNSHIRIQNVVDISGGNSFEDGYIIDIDYVYALDWFNSRFHDNILLYKNSTVEFNSPIFVTNQIISCLDLTKRLSDYHFSLKPVHIGRSYDASSFVINSSGEDGNNKCSFANIDVFTGEILDSKIGLECQREMMPL